MRNSIIIPSLILLSSLLLSCKKSKLEHSKDLHESAAAWSGFKKKNGDNYKYEVTGGSWVGVGWKTVITVRNGKVVQRYFKLTPSPNYPNTYPPNQLEWTENENQLDTHKDSPAAALLTLDQVYEKARNEWLIKREKTTIYFESKNNGMISLCGYVNNECADDCFIGIRISYIEPI